MPRPETILEAREAAKPKKKELTIQDRVEINKRITNKFKNERLRAAFGKSRDYVEKKFDLLDQLQFEEEKDLAPTRKKVSRLDDNIGKLTRKPHPLMANLVSKALANVTGR